MSGITILLVAALALVIGLMMGIVGGGGGGIYIVLLVLLLHQNIKSAAISALILSTFTLSGAAWQYWHKKQFRMDYFLLITVLDCTGTLAGVHLMKGLNENFLKIFILAVLLFSGVSSLLKIKSKESGEPLPLRRKLPTAIPVGLLSGLVTGLSGLTGGTSLSSCLVGFLGFSPYLAVGTSTLVSFLGNLLSILLLIFSSVFFHTASIGINTSLLLAFGIPSAAGAVFGAKLAPKINKKVLILALAAMAILPGIYLAVKGI